LPDLQGWFDYEHPCEIGHRPLFPVLSAKAGFSRAKFHRYEAILIRLSKKRVISIVQVPKFRLVVAELDGL